jgi:hypothetical protein
MAFITYYKKFPTVIVSAYFWTRFISSLLNVLASLSLVLSINVSPIQLFMDLGVLGIDIYISVIVYSFWQLKKSKDLQKKE